MDTTGNNQLGRSLGLLVILLAAITWLPWLSLPLFNTKGEPREAIVAVSMLRSGNWILPLSMGADIPYKPPMLAWLIALFSLPAGHVTEFTSRLPSALAAIFLIWATYSFVRRHDGRRVVAALTSLLLMTSFEVWRAASACRVDMVLTAAIVGSIYALYDWLARGMRGIPWAAVPLLTVAVLTKGPVGFIIPPLCVWLYNWCRPHDTRRQWRLTWVLAVTVVLSSLLPALWYVLAARQGGDTFLDLVYEENIGRATGTMSYESHVNGPLYNPMTLAAGMLPYTIAMLLCCFAVRWRGIGRRFIAWWKTPGRAEVRVFALVSALAVILFYTIPSSKRSVYILPMYPFVAYGVTLAILWLAGRARRLALSFAVAMGCVAAIIGLTGMIGPFVPEKFLKGLPLVHEWLCHPSAVIMAIVCFGVALFLLINARRLHGRSILAASIAGVCVSLWTLSSGILPGVLNAKSDLPAARAAEAVTLPDEHIYQFVGGPLLRFYTVNFYLSDRVRIFDSPGMPSHGVLLISVKDLDAWRELYGGEYDLSEPLWKSERKSCDTKSPILLIPFFHR